MEDKTILKIAESTAHMLSKADFPISVSHIIPSYNAILKSAKENHPDDEFLNTLNPIEEDIGDGFFQLKILFSQLRIVVEALQEEEQKGGQT